MSSSTVVNAVESLYILNTYNKKNKKRNSKKNTHINIHIPERVVIIPGIGYVLASCGGQFDTQKGDWRTTLGVAVILMYWNV